MNELQIDSSFNHLLNTKGEEAYHQFMEFLKTQQDVSINSDNDLMEKLKEHVFVQEFSRNENSVKIFFNQINGQILYVTNNVTKFFGYTPEAIIKFNFPLIFSSLVVEHISFPLKATKWSIKIYKRVHGDVFSQNLRMTYCGVKFRRQDKSISHLLVKYLPVTFTATGKIHSSIITIEDVSHLLKSDFFWGRISMGVDDKYKFHFISNKKTEFTQDIISDREKEILRLVAQGMASKDIGTQLFISSGTVDNHRKNMIARTGARDTTALIQLCISCGII